MNYELAISLDGKTIEYMYNPRISIEYDDTTKNITKGGNRFDEYIGSDLILLRQDFFITQPMVQLIPSTISPISINDTLKISFIFNFFI